MYNDEGQAGGIRKMPKFAEAPLQMSKGRTDALVTVVFALTEKSPDGVLIATVWDSEGKPLAERLIYRQPAHVVNVKLTADAKQYFRDGR